MASEFISEVFENLPDGRASMNQWLTSRSADGWEVVSISATPPIAGPDMRPGRILVVVRRAL